MNFALIGADAAARPLLAAIVANPGHRLTHAVLAFEMAAELLKLSPSVRLADAWDEIIARSQVDCVIVAGSDPAILEGARQLAAAGKSLVILPKAAQGTTWFYEMGLIRDDMQVALVPLLVARCHPPVRQLQRLIANGAVGQVLQLQLERDWLVREPMSVPLLSAADVNEAFFADVDLLRMLGGDYSRVTSLHSGIAGERLSQATNTLSGDGLPEALWMLKGSQDASRWRLSVTGESGLLSLTCCGEADDCNLTHDGVEVAPDALRSQTHRGNEMLQHCVAALSGESVRPDWTDLTRAAEICDGARRSVRRRRTIDLHFESTSERSQFKTQMTAIGCSLLSLTLLGVVCVLIAGSLLDPRDAAESKAEHAGAIVYESDFIPGSTELTAEAEKALKDLATDMRGTTFPVLIEGDPHSEAQTIDAARRLAVISRLKAAGAADAERRIELAHLKGKGFRILMTVARLLVFVPLGVFLVLQLLLFVSRPARSSRHELRESV